MIGYIRIYKPELKYREFIVYNSYYCGICKSLGDRYGLIYRNFINYDAVFIAVLLDGALETTPGFEMFRCVLHPLKKKSRCSVSDNISYAADLTVYLTHMKLKDNIMDENDLVSKTGDFLLKKGFIKSKRLLQGTAEMIDSGIRELNVLENEKSTNIDKVSGCYGRVLKAIVEQGSRGSGIEAELGWIAFHLGKWVYLADAFMDLKKDAKNKVYNPYLIRFGYEKEDIESFIVSIRERAAFLMFASLDEMTAAFEEIAKRINSGIIRNIMYEGLYDLTEKILNGESSNNASKESI